MAYEFYSLLWVDRSASADDIKKAYRKKAMELHPDRHRGDPSKEAEFKKVNEAYSVLSDETKKAHYDRFGTTEGPQGFGPSGFSGGFWQEFDMGDIFETFFGGRSSQWRRREIGADIEITVSLSFAEAYTGVQKEVQFEKQILCPDCKGSGAKSASDITSCPDCGWSGKVRRRVQTLFGVMEQSSSCERCDGTGKVIRVPCGTCKGHRYIEEKRKRTIDVPAGIDDEMTIKLRDEGHEGKDGSGDLFVHFRVPDTFQGLVREGNHVRYRVSFDPVEFILWTKKRVTIPLIGDKEIDIKPGTDPGSELVFKQEGFPDVSKKAAPRGNCILELALEIPKKLSKKERELYQAIAQEKRLDTYDAKGFFEKLFD